MLGMVCPQSSQTRSKDHEVGVHSDASLELLPEFWMEDKEGEGSSKAGANRGKGRSKSRTCNRGCSASPNT